MGTTLEEADFRGACARLATFIGANVAGGNFSGSVLKGVEFMQADLHTLNSSGRTWPGVICVRRTPAMPTSSVRG